MDLSQKIDDVDSSQCDEDLMAETQLKQEQLIQQIQSDISALENDIQKKELQKKDYESQLNQMKEQINLQSIISDLNDEQQKLKLLQTKIEYINKKIQNNDQEKDSRLEQEIARDSIFLGTLLKQKDARIQTIRDKINQLRPITNVQNNLQMLYEELETQKAKLQILKSTPLGDKQTNYKEIHNRMLRNLNELKIKQEKMAAIKEQIQDVNNQLSQEKDQQLTLKCKLKLVDTIYKHYVNQCEQQRTIISNLQNGEQNF